VLSYRHVFHAGNVADVFKHSVLCALLRAAVHKPAPLFYLDTHAGAGVSPLRSADALANAEFRAGIGALRGLPEAGRPEAVADLLSAVALYDDQRKLARYPGSPVIAARLLRAQDRLRLAELHPDDHARLVRRLARDRRVSIARGDGYSLLASDLPPHERRAIVLIDPNYERDDEGHRLLAALERGLERFRNGCYLIWYPCRGKLDAMRFLNAFEKLRPPKTLQLELDPGTDAVAGTPASGLLVINPAFAGIAALSETMAYLGRHLAPGGAARVEWRVSE